MSALTKNIPSLQEWLGDEPRGEGFEEFERWVSTQLSPPPGDTPANEAKMIRIMQTFMVSCVEQLNREAKLDPSEAGAIEGLQMWSRAAGYALMTALASAAVEGAPLRRAVPPFVEEFRRGAKMVADAIAEGEAHS